MSKRIGELLIEQGVLDPQGLDRALKAQLIFGGHLGTNLIELGLVDELSLGAALSEMLRVPYAPQVALENVPQDAIESLTRAQVEKHRIVPLRRKENELHVAVIHPKELGTLSQRTGFKILPHVAPEIRVFQAMETYYGIPRRARYLTLCHGLDGAPGRPPAVPGRQVAAAASNRAGVGPGPTGAAGVAVGGNTVTAAPADESLTDLATLGEEFGYGRDWREIIDENDQRDREPRAEGTAADDRASPEPPNEYERLLCRLSCANNKGDLSTALLDYLARTANGAILFGVRSSAAFVWDSRGLELKPELTRGLRLPVTAGSIFTLLLGRTHYRGRVPDEPACRRFYSTLQIDPPNEILILPIYLDDRLLAILYADRRDGGRLGATTDEYRTLGDKLSLAMNVLILRHKIRSP